MADNIQLYREKIEETLAFLAQEITSAPEIIILLGTGLGTLVEKMERRHLIPYKDIPHFPQSTVSGHAGNLIFGSLGGRRVAVLQGRFHYYEGYSTRELTLPVRVLSLLGAKYFFVSNVSGGLNPEFAAGTLMVIRDHLNFIPDNPLRGLNVDAWGIRFPDMTATYHPELIDITVQCAARLGLNQVRTGIYVAIPGPSLETPAETRWLRSCGADAVGMSTVPEVIVAKHAGLKILGISVIANVNNPDNQQPIVLEDIIAQAGRAGQDFQRLILEVIEAI